MRISIKLSESSIQDAIKRLENAEENLRVGARDTVEILAKAGAMVANAKYGAMATATDEVVSTGMNDGKAVARIVVGGRVPLIAEFGAGDTTVPPDWLFENSPATPVYSGSYSETVGTGQYALLGEWEFPTHSGNWMSAVEPRLGLYEAKEHIIQDGANVAMEVIHL